MDREPVVLLVEDNPDDLELAQMALRDARVRAQIVVARDGVEALAFLRATGEYAGRPSSADPQLVLLDLKLPRQGGLEVLAEMRACDRCHGIPVVVLSSSGEGSDITQAYAAGANSYIRKPVSYADFAAVVRQLSTYWLTLNQLPPRVDR